MGQPKNPFPKTKPSQDCSPPPGPGALEERRVEFAGSRELAAFVTVVIGIVTVLASILILMRTFSGLVIGLEDSNPARIAVAVAIVSLTAAVACWVPVRRATRIDPLSALPSE